jgi:nicotinamidase-related amidase
MQRACPIPIRGAYRDGVLPHASGASKYSFLGGVLQHPRLTMKTKRGNAVSRPNDVALLIIDVQMGLFKKSTPIYQAERLLQNINTLVGRAHQAGVPVFYVQHSDKKTLVKGSDSWQLHPELHPLEEDCIVPKCHVSAFEQTILQDALTSKAIGTLVVTGLVTYACVRATCIDAMKRGYRVVLVGDGHSNHSRHALQVVRDWNKKLRARGIDVQSTSEIGFSQVRMS